MHKKILHLSLLLILTTGCGSTNKPTTAVTHKQPEQKPQVTISTPEAVLARAEQAQDPTDDLVQLVAMVSENSCAKALQVGTLITNRFNEMALNPELGLVLARCLLEEQKYQDAERWLTAIPDDSRWMPQKHQMLVPIYQNTQRWWLAAKSLNMSGEPGRENALQVWHLLLNLTDKEVSHYLNEISTLHPMLKLLQLQRSLSSDFKNAQQGIALWQEQNAAHSFAQQLPEPLQSLVSQPIKQYNNITILLPLSGQLKAQGEAVKEGILAANYANNFADKHLKFVDTANWNNGDFESPDFSETDLVIGPLLKANIDQVKALIPSHIPVLFLNRTEQQNTAEKHYFYSLAPEDEAQQLADTLADQGFKYPMIIAADSATYQRMQQAFIAAWQERRQSSPVTLVFSDNNAVREGVNDRLALTDSKARVRQIRNLLKPELHSFERNRRDIDSIIIFANASQTELINPLIEASTSPFSAIIPVYATSRSFSRNLSENDLRDLRNLHFIEMPWMLESKEYTWMRKRADQLWPGRRDALQRLFAMGYDAVNMAPYLPFLAALPNQTWQGLTGNITLDSAHQTIRQTISAQFSNQDIKIIASD